MKNANVSTLTMDHNLGYKNGGDFIVTPEGKYRSFDEFFNTTGKGVNSISADPKFKDPGNGDFRLQSSSPAIDAGVDVGIRTDLEGKNRPSGNGVDLGAYEFGGQPINR